MSTVQKEIGDLHARAEAAKPELAKAARQKRTQAADGGIHTVDRAVKQSRKQEAEESATVIRPPVKRWQRAHALAQNLVAPPGTYIEWVRRDNQHRGDHENMIAYIQEGWELCRKTDFPKHTLPTQRLPDHGDVIGNTSSVLMKIDLELKAQRDAFYNDKRDATTKAVNKPKPGLADAAHPAMPLVEDENRSSAQMEASRIRRARRSPTIAP